MGLPIGTETLSGALRVTALPTAAAQWHAAFAPLSFPAAPEQRARLWKNMQVLMADRRAEANLGLSVCLDLSALNGNNTVKRISENGRLWGPEMGLGVAPGEAPPRLWTSADFLDRNYDAPIPELMRNVVLLDTDEKD